jgi:filamentous hemagglutinin
MLGDHEEIAGIALTGGLGAGVKTVGRAEGTATAVGDDLKNLNPTSALTDAEAASGTGTIAKLLDDASHQLERYIGSFGNKYKPPTVIGAVDPWTGKIVTTSSGAVPSTIAPELKAYADSLGGLGVKTACGNTLGRCAEFRAANELLLSNPGLKLSDIKFTAAVRPRTGEVVPRCENCTNIFGAE